VDNCICGRAASLESDDAWI